MPHNNANIYCISRCECTSNGVMNAYNEAIIYQYNEQSSLIKDNVNTFAFKFTQKAVSTMSCVYDLEQYSHLHNSCPFFWFRNCPPTLVEGDYSNGFVRPSVRQSIRPFIDTILSPQLLLQFSRDFDKTFQLLFP